MNDLVCEKSAPIYWVPISVTATARQTSCLISLMWSRHNHVVTSARPTDQDTPRVRRRGLLLGFAHCLNGSWELNLESDKGDRLRSCSGPRRLTGIAHTRTPTLAHTHAHTHTQSHAHRDKRVITWIGKRLFGCEDGTSKDLCMYEATVVNYI